MKHYRVVHHKNLASVLSFVSHVGLRCAHVPLSQKRQSMQASCISFAAYIQHVPNVTRHHYYLPPRDNPPPRAPGRRFSLSLGPYFLSLRAWSEQVTKHAGSVKKGFALIGGILVTAVVQSSLETSALTPVRDEK